MAGKHELYEAQNRQQAVSECDGFTDERYEQFFRHMGLGTVSVLDVGCNTGRGGKRLKELNPSLLITGLDCVRERLDALPSAYIRGIYGLSTEIPVEDRSFDVVLAGEFLEHLYPADVDKTLCEFQRVLRIGGQLMLTTPNPGYLRNRVHGWSVYRASHLTQHHAPVLRFRLLMHGFTHVRLYGSGRVSRFLGQFFPLRSVYGSYLIVARKF